MTTSSYLLCKGWGDDDGQNPETNDRRWEKRGGYNDKNSKWNQDNNADNSNQNNIIILRHYIT